MSSKVEEIAIIAIIIGIVLIIAVTLAWVFLPPPTNYTIGGGIFVAGVIVLIGGVVIVTTARTCRTKDLIE